MELTAAARALIQKARATRLLSPKDQMRAADLQLQHPALLAMLEAVTSEREGLELRHRELSERVTELLSTLNEIAPGVWRLKHYKEAPAFWRAVAGLAEFFARPAKLPN